MSGRWTIVSEGTEGRHRWYAAKRAPAESAKPLSDRERETLTRALYGESNKQIAYTLGIGSSAVSTLLSRARRKLRGRIPEDLLASLMGALRAPPALPTVPPPSGLRDKW
jgi:DNA-binding CsgD family transcriptional regulator